MNYFYDTQRWPQKGSMNLPFGKKVCQEENAIPNFAVFVLHLLKFCLLKGKQTPWRGHKVTILSYLTCYLNKDAN